LPEELPSVRGEGFDVATLAFGEDRIERQTRLPAAGEACEYDEFVPRQVERDVFEIMFARPADGDFVLHDVIDELTDSLH